MLNAIHKSQKLLDSRQANVLSNLARTGSFTETGRELFLTHLGISHSIQALESQLGCRLLNRLGKKVDYQPIPCLFNPHCRRSESKRLTQANFSGLAFVICGSLIFRN
jgi:Bacterial regulatory helix-turn-helix protein, lysR family